jgi:inhibitor of KinA
MFSYRQFIPFCFWLLAFGFWHLAFIIYHFPFISYYSKNYATKSGNGINFRFAKLSAVLSINVNYTIFPLGDSALIIDFGNIIHEEINSKVLSLFQQLKSLSLPFVTDIIPAYSSLTICYNVSRILQKSNFRTAFETIIDTIENAISQEEEKKYEQKRLVKIPVCYAEKYAPDMQEVAQQKGLPAVEIISLHTAKRYRVFMIGFLPGFAYMGEVDDKIAMPRKAQPRKLVQAGSVGIAGKQTGIYPLASPGGWQIIGKTPVRLFDREAEPPVFFQPGDEVEFYSISEDEFENYQSGHS